LGWLGLDDTDSLNGGCTTEVLFELLKNLPDNVTFSNPRLVRLWPFAQRRTRGNAAVAVELTTENEEALLKHLDAWWSQHIVSLKGEIGTSDHSDRTQHPADPGMVWISETMNDEAFYKSAVSSEILVSELPSVTRQWGGNGRIGATAAILWPVTQCTYEAIAWRKDDSNGPRQLDEEALSLVDDHDDTFLCRNPKLGTSLLAPRGNSPVLFGIRAWSKEGAQHALTILENGKDTEPSKGSLVFQTNQATGDHLVKPIEAVVRSKSILKKGHVVLETSEGQWMAFRQSHKVALLSQWLIEGDIILGNGLRDEKNVLHLELLKVKQSMTEQKRPRCKVCNKSMKSMGKNQGLRCKKCNQTSTRDWVEVERHAPFDGWVQPPPSSRRHLSKPLEER
jgi:tRNA(Ile2)-agmatinylcytidine synthase